MHGVSLEIARDLEFSRIVVWDALIDADLVSGWLAEATITPRVGGDYVLNWVHRAGSPTIRGTIATVRRPDLLEVVGPELSVKFRLRDMPAIGLVPRTRLTVAVESAADSVFEPTVRADWMTALDLLVELLHGHPADWAHWDEEHHELWSRHLDEAQRRA